MRLIISVIIFFMLSLLLIQCSENGTSSFKYTFIEHNQGIELQENNKPVLFYQRAVKSIDGKYARNNYIHPLYSLNGDTLTEDFPDDHPHQRGIFWAWHQIIVDTAHIADGWGLNNFTIEVVEAATTTKKDTAIIKLHALYKSPLYKNSTPYLDERTLIKVSRYGENARTIDFTISLRALAPKLRLGGSENEKGYGGFSIRLRMPDSLKFLSQNGYVKPQTLQIKAGPWLDFSAPYGKNGEISGVTIFDDTRNPNYPQPWIIRQKKSMQNIVWPGEHAVEIPTDKTLVLRYRIVVHHNQGNKEQIRQWQIK